MVQLHEISSGSAYFAPAEQVGAAALLIEPTEFNADAMTDNGRKDQVIATVTAFATLDDLDNGVGAESVGLKVEQTVLARELKSMVGGATVVTVRQLAPRNGNRGAWVFDRVSPTVSNKVVEYIEKRDAKVAEALSGDDVPDYLK